LLQLLHTTKRHDRAIAVGREGIRFYPNSEYFAGWMMVSLLASEQPDEAVAECRRLVEIGAQRAIDAGFGAFLNDLVRDYPGVAATHFCLALLYDSAGDRGKAATCYRAYLQAEPAGTYAAEARERCQKQ